MIMRLAWRGRCDTRHTPQSRPDDVAALQLAGIFGLQVAGGRNTCWRWRQRTTAARRSYWRPAV